MILLVESLHFLLHKKSVEMVYDIRYRNVFLARSEDAPDVKFLPSAALHIEAAASIATGQSTVKDFEPNNLTK